jgi:hypothetical protein
MLSEIEAKGFWLKFESKNLWSLDELVGTDTRVVLRQMIHSHAGSQILGKVLAKEEKG